MCTPSLVIDTLLTSGVTTHFFLVKRKDFGKYATKGGFVGMSEPTEEAVVRELKEEINIDVSKGSSDPVLFGVYGGLVRGARRYTTSAVYASHHQREIFACIFQFSHTPVQTVEIMTGPCKAHLFG